MANDTSFSSQSSRPSLINRSKAISATLELDLESIDIWVWLVGTDQVILKMVILSQKYFCRGRRAARKSLRALHLGHGLQKGQGRIYQKAGGPSLSDKSSMPGLYGRGPKWREGRKVLTQIKLHSSSPGTLLVSSSHTQRARRLRGKKPI